VEHNRHATALGALRCLMLVQTRAEVDLQHHEDRRTNCNLFYNDPSSEDAVS
jgi:hypothetical protein